MDAKQLAMLIFGSIIVIAAAYYTTYYIASRGNRLQRGRIIRVHDKTTLTKDNALYIVEVANKYYLLGATNQSFTLIDTLDSSDVGNTDQSYSAKVDMSFIQTGFTDVKNNKLLNRVKDIARKNRETTADKTNTESKVSVAKEEDDLDAVYRKIQTRRAGVAAADPKKQDGKEKNLTFESFLNSEDK